MNKLIERRPIAASSSRIGGRELRLLLACILLCWPAVSSAAAPKSTATAAAAAAADENKPSQDSANSNYEKASKARKLIERPASVNLKSIIEHQEALEFECAKYNERNIGQLKQLLRFNDDHNGGLQLPNPVLVKVPAVCLFLFSQESGSLGSAVGQVKSRQHSSRLDLVNWMYNLDDIKPDSSSSSNKTKRQTTTANELGDDLISDYLLEQNSIQQQQATTTTTTGDYDAEDGEQLAKFHADIGRMLSNERFHSAIEGSRQQMARHLSPVVLIPGLLGSRLQAKTDKLDRVNIFCTKQSDWQDFWLSIRQLLPIAIDCWLDNARLEYDPASGFTRSPPRVISRVADFGLLESVSHLDVRQPALSGYFKPIIDRYLELGYTANQNLLAAPYDFRLAPQELEASFFADLKQLIEGAHTSSPSGKKVTLVCHSMGCTHALVFLRAQSAAWRQARVRKLIALSSPWGGAMKALKALVVGDSLDLPLASETKMRKLARTYPSIAYLLPQAEIFAQTNGLQADSTRGGPILVQTPERDYRAHEIEQLLRDLNLTIQLDWFKRTSVLIKPLEPLHDLRVDCIYSTRTPTPETLIFKEQRDFPDGNYELVRGAGDGTVNLASLLVCDHWARMLPDLVRQKEVSSSNHVGVIGAKDTLDHITDDVFMS